MSKVVFMLKKSRITISIASLSTFLLINSQPVFAAIRDDGDEPGVAISGAATVALFIGFPLLIIGLISLAILAPQWSRKARRESGFVSHTETWWLNGPGDEAKHVELEASDEDLGALILKAGGVSAKW
ncbi:hypothetical protein LBMAG05_09370 [Actinomycetes bacterium]|jgi:hypothetical protein|nr:hypothetical protein LBMAG05_09370 [Actinomycetes bacterium]